MKKAEERLVNAEEQKAKIRERYKGVDENQLTKIPALPVLDIFNRNRILRVAVYARVSTDSPNQTSSYELQKNYYTDLIDRNPNWELVEVYADEGISGTSLQHRDSFLRMIDDCIAGKIDLIITKSVSRFARNILDGIGYVRKLSSLDPPVGVFFETENINSLNKDSEMALAFMATMAQEESHNKSEIMNASIEMRFSRGIFLTPPLLGYDRDNDGNLIINEEEALTVRLIFLMYLSGYSCQEIATTLSKLKRKTKKGNTLWSSGSVMQQLQNERHCGSVLARKTWTPNYLDHKSKKNRRNKNQYKKDNHHEPIISRKTFIRVQHMIENAKYGNKGFFPELHVIPDGALKGYVIVNPRWAGFKPQDYLAASASVYNESEHRDTKTHIANSGDFDLRGYEIARSQFFNISNKLTVTISLKKIKFGLACIKKLDCQSVEILVHPTEMIMLVRSAPLSSRNFFQWRIHNSDRLVSREISVSSITPCLFNLFGWNSDYKYSLTGIFFEKGDNKVLLFNLRETEFIIPTESDTQQTYQVNAIDERTNTKTPSAKNSFRTFPKDWNNNFGRSYYLHQQDPENILQKTKELWSAQALDSVFQTNPELGTLDPDTLAEKIQALINIITAKEKTKNE